MITVTSQHMHESLKDHLLEEVPAGELKAYWMRRPKTHPNHWTYSVLVVFTPVGILLGGDIRITRRASITSVPGYGEDWFGGYLDEQYLCEKFDFDWSTRPPKSRRAEEMRAACGWLSAVQQKFNILWQDMMVKKGFEPPKGLPTAAEGRSAS
jgi:hypothetical protein